MTTDLDRVAAAISDRYVVRDQLGSGGMAVVYRAHDRKHDRPVAIKVLRPEVSRLLGAARFLREIKIAAHLNHPHILPLFDSGETGGILYYVMPLVEGHSLRDRLRRDRRLPVAEAVRVAHGVAGALEYAHQRGVIHRDIKPENIMITGGVALVADFGIARAMDSVTPEDLTETGFAVGTPMYMSPEQISGTVDNRSDIYSLGCVLYETITGDPPFPGSTVQAVLTQRFLDSAPSMLTTLPEVPEHLDAVVRRATSPNPDARFATAAAFAESLEHVGGRELAANGSPVPATTGGESGRWSAARRHLNWRTAVIGGALGLAAWGAVARGGIATRPTPVDGLAPDAARAIAVLPFVDLSAGGDHQYLGDGVAEELANGLARLPGVRVASRTSSFAFRGRTERVGEIGRQLGVGTVVEGSVRPEGERVRISARLISVADGFELWGQDFDRDIGEVFAVEDEIARAIVGALEVEVQPDVSVIGRATEDRLAYDLYLRGRHEWNVRTPASLRLAAEYFTQARDRDPEYALAWAGLADTYNTLALNLYAPPNDYFPLGKAAALRAIELDDGLAEAHAALALVSYLYDRDWARAESEYARALAINPHYAVARYFYAIYLTAVMRFEEAEVEALRARADDPLSPPINLGVGMVHYHAGRFQQAVDELQRTIALAPDYYFPYLWLGRSLAFLGRYDEAVAAARQGIELNRNSLPLSMLGEVYARAGRRDEAMDIVRELTTGDQTFPAAHIAKIYAALGDIDRAFEWLDTSVANREAQLIHLREPALANLQSDPRFAALVRAVGLE